MADNEKIQMAMRQANERLEAFLREKGSENKESSPSAELVKMLRALDKLPTRKELDRAYLDEVLRRTHYNQRTAAEIMGITPQALCARVKKINFS